MIFEILLFKYGIQCKTDLEELSDAHARTRNRELEIS